MGNQLQKQFQEKEVEDYEQNQVYGDTNKHDQMTEIKEGSSVEQNAIFEGSVLLKKQFQIENQKQEKQKINQQNNQQEQVYADNQFPIIILHYNIQDQFPDQQNVVSTTRLKEQTYEEPKKLPAIEKQILRDVLQNENENMIINQDEESQIIISNSDPVETTLMVTAQNIQVESNNLQQEKQVVCHQNLKQEQQNEIKYDDNLSNIEIKISTFSQILCGSTIKLDTQLHQSIQNGVYYENQKLVLTQVINSRQAKIKFQIQNIKYCVGFGIALKEIIINHSFNYKSYENQLSHGLYLVTSQGYSWSHSNKLEDDVFRASFKKMKSGDVFEVILSGNQAIFKGQKESFSLQIPEIIYKKYSICFCAYLHEKNDSISILQ